MSWPEQLETVSAARGVERVYGARMTGAGFGGCLVVLADERVAGPFPAAIGPVRVMHRVGADAGDG
ncbi:MAG: hypothetical protein JJU44_01065 [Planctomycetes bacterium]|nr:hypothetical protein [Planctomycetota bacterium]